MEEKKKGLSACFTGHRPQKLLCQFNEEHRMCLLIKEFLHGQIEALINKGVYHFLQGCAIGTDIWAAEEVVKIGIGHEPKITLDSCFAYRTNYEKGATEWDRRLKEIMKFSQSQIFVSEEYSKDCFGKRDRYMVDNSDMVIGVFDRRLKYSGTAKTINYAKKLGRLVIFYDPYCKETFVYKKQTSSIKPYPWPF